MDVNTVFTRLYLTEVLKDVKKHFPLFNLKKDGWTYKHGDDHFEFQITGQNAYDVKFYWSGSAHNAYEARAKGWNSFLQKMLDNRTIKE